MDKITKLVPLIDGDLLVYRCGFSADAQAKRDNLQPEDDYLEWALGNTRTTIEGILANFPEAPTFEMYLSGPTNFRDSVATIQPYKGTRDPTHKPKYYKEIKDYLKGYWNATVVDGMEADDAIGIAQWSKPDKSTVICSIDKDMLMIPGYHFNWVKGNLHKASLLEANQHFYRQMLEGDRVDNIPGIKGVGPVTVNKLFEETNGDLAKIKSKVLDYYKTQYKEASGPAYHEVATLLFIRREENKTYKDYGL